MRLQNKNDIFIFRHLQTKMIYLFLDIYKLSLDIYKLMFDWLNV